MPALELFGHKTLIAGDSLRVPSALAILLRVMQLAVAVPLLALINDLDLPYSAELVVVCAGGVGNGKEIFYAYLAVSIFSALVSILIDGCMYVPDKK